MTDLQLIKIREDIKGKLMNSFFEMNQNGITISRDMGDIQLYLNTRKESEGKYKIVPFNKIIPNLIFRFANIMEEDMVTHIIIIGKYKGDSKLISYCLIDMIPDDADGDLSGRVLELIDGEKPLAATMESVDEKSIQDERMSHIVKLEKDLAEDRTIDADMFSEIENIKLETLEGFMFDIARKFNITLEGNITLIKENVTESFNYESLKESNITFNLPDLNQIKKDYKKNRDNLTTHYQEENYSKLKEDLSYTLILIMKLKEDKSTDKKDEVHEMVILNDAEDRFKFLYPQIISHSSKGFKFADYVLKNYGNMVEGLDLRRLNHEITSIIAKR